MENGVIGHQNNRDGDLDAGQSVITYCRVRSKQAHPSTHGAHDLLPASTAWGAAESNGDLYVPNVQGYHYPSAPTS